MPSGIGSLICADKNFYVIIIIIVNAFQYYRMSNELKTEELETSEVLTVCSNLCSQPLDTLP